MQFLGIPVGIPFKDPVIRFYAICLLLGGVVAMIVANYRAHKDGFKGFDFFDVCFPIAFLCGIIGGRIWYVIASFDEFAGRPFWEVFNIRSGGLAIQGGAIGGILAGVLFCFFRKKGTSILHIMDYAIPTILIGQAIGRFGNFFNQEVFGHFIASDNWDFLPGFIFNNMQNGDLNMGEYTIGGELISVANTGIQVPEGSIAAPLFLVEGIVNILFYFLIAYGLPTVMGKYYEDGDESFSYFIAYGIIRLILEPLRNSQFIMGDIEIGNKSSYKSVIMAIVYIIIGVVLIAINHLLHYLAKHGKFDRVPKLKSIFLNNYLSSTIKVSNVNENLEESSSIDLNALKKAEEELNSNELEQEKNIDESTSNENSNSLSENSDDSETTSEN